MWNLFSTNIKMGLRSALKGLDYYRAREYEILLTFSNRCNRWAGKSILDLACGEEVLPIFLAKSQSRKIFAVDYDFTKLSLQRRFQRKSFNSTKLLCLAQMDGLTTGFKNNSFDIVINLAMISLLEGDNDTRLVCEIARILKPMGILCISLGYRESGGEGWEESAGGFFRRYDEETLKQRILETSKLKEIGKTYFGESCFKFSKYWYHMPFLVRLPFRWASPVFTLFFCKELAYNQRKSADGVFLVLQKQN